jgi:hypothetical protein
MRLFDPYRADVQSVVRETLIRCGPCVHIELRSSYGEKEKNDVKIDKAD